MSPSPRLRPALCIAMPSSAYAPRSSGELPPKTPDGHDEPMSAVEPPPRPNRDTYPTYKVRRRRRADLTVPAMPDIFVDAAIPTIETSEVDSEASSPLLQPTTGAHGLLAPMPSFQRIFTPPKTPAAQVNPSFTQPESPAHEWQLITDARSKKPAFERSASVCSSFSDSSVSSCGSSGFSVPHGAGCASPMSETTDPFMEDERHDKGAVSDQATSPSAKRVKRGRGVKWTTEMDQHLEATYVRYLQDPRVTPFKTLPGVPPPLGVCSRVACKARRTWGHYRSATPTPLDTIVESDKSRREGSPDTIRPDTADTSSTTSSKQQPPWPRSDSATRRRLRHIVKHKPALSAYYQRLLHSRSVSPFPPSAPVATSESVPSDAPFSSRDLTISLVTSTAPSMQPEGPLTQITSEEMAASSSRPRPQSLRVSRPSEWFSRIGRSSAHQKSQSLQLHLNIAPTHSEFGSLASPFDDDSSRSHLLQSMGTTKSLGRRDFPDFKPALDSPFEGASTASRSLKRRFKSDEEKSRRPGLEDVFDPPPAESNSSAAPVPEFPTRDFRTVRRHRGFSLGAVRATDSLTRLFDPPPPVPPLPRMVVQGVPAQVEPALATPMALVTTPSSPPPLPTSRVTPPPANLSTPLPSITHTTWSTPDEEMSEAFGEPIPSGARSAPRRLAEPIPRLGSPFMEAAAAAAASHQSNTFPRRYIPTPTNPSPFQDRLRELAARELMD